MTLREARKRRLLTIRALAEQAGVSTRTIRLTEAGEQTPLFVTIRKLAAALDVRPEEIAEFRAAMGMEGER